MPIWFLILIILALGYLFYSVWRAWDSLPPLTESQDIYYDPHLNKLFQVRKRSFCSLICGSMCSYYSDAHTSIGIQRLSPAYLLRCKKVVNVDQCSFLFHDDIGWRVK